MCWVWTQPEKPQRPPQRAQQGFSSEGKRGEVTGELLTGPTAQPYSPLRQTTIYLTPLRVMMELETEDTQGSTTTEGAAVLYNKDFFTEIKHAPFL